MKEIVLKSKRMKALFTGEEMKREILAEVPTLLQSKTNQYELLRCISIQDHIRPNWLTDEHIKMLEDELRRKQNSYKQQDVKKGLYDENALISIDEIKHLLLESLLECKFCSQSVKLLYSKVREELQWTLDRIDNDIGHNRGNVEIVCLRCNLQRRRTNYDKFYFTKTMVISKED